MEFPYMVRIASNFWSVLSTAVERKWNFEQDTVARDCIQCGYSLSHQSMPSVRCREVYNAGL
ncbi:hypothetical protein BDR05DRAFT_959961 [Suillus weaverae]|nr:hypothetical protein BDR05DRAFT_959961 [Suillus weaverae]